jgi:zinc protease
MKPSLFSLLSLVLLLSGTLSSAKELKTETFQIRKYETQVLPNGLTILWVADPALPYVAMQMMVKVGSAQDPQGKEGLADFTTSMLDRGTKSHSASQISENLEQIGSGFSSSANQDYTLLATSALSFNKESLLKQFGEIVMQPTFTNAELERYRKQVLGSMQKLADRPEEFMQYLMPHFIFGSHPYGHEAVGRPTAIKSLKRVDLQNFYNTYYTADNSVLAVVGQYDDEFKTAVVNMFSAWKTKAAPKTEVPDFPQWKGRELLLVDRGDLNQAQIDIGFKGIPRNLPEYLQMRAALKILGESFGSRLFDEIRVRRALTYHIYAWFDPLLKPGPMGIYTFTRTDKIGETIEQTLNTYKKFVQDGVTDAEVSDVKALMRGQFPRIFETPQSLATQLLILNRYGISADYLTHYLVDLEVINKDALNKTIRKYFDTDNLRILVYAPKAKAEEIMRKMGNLEVKSYKDFL